MINSIGMIGILGYLSLEDITKKQIHATLVCLLGILGVISHLVTRNLRWQEMVFGACVGVGLYLISVVSREKIGKGDALVVATMGVYLGFWKTMAVLWLASFVAAVAGFILLFSGKKGRDYEMAFVPFLFLSYLSLFIVQSIYG